ncbi:response regulator [bacterium]|jgi:YesN/AraC family two-component response regulator|nr:response regulator [bacterium]
MTPEQEKFAENGKKLNILIVEDEKLVRNSVKTICSLFFNNIDEAENGQDAINKYQSGDYDIIFTDLSMPVMTGDMLIREIRTVDKELTICIMSKYDEDSYDGLFADVKIEAFFKKPLNYKELIFKLNDKVKNLGEIKDLTTLKLQEQAKTWKSIKEQRDATIKIIETTNSLINKVEKMAELVGGSKFNSFVNLKTSFLTISNLLNKFKGLEKMSKNVLEIHNIIKEVEENPAKLNDFSSFNLLLAIFEDFETFIRKVFLIRKIKDLHYLDDSILSSIKQLRANIFMEDEGGDDLELF